MLAGYTRRNKLVNFAGPKELVGQIVKVKIMEAKSYSLRGEFVEVVKQTEVHA